MSNKRPQQKTVCVICKCRFLADRFRVKRGMVKCCSTSCRGVLARRALPKHFGRPSVHGASSGGKITRLYRIWTGMKRRCHSPNSGNYHVYGAKGIRVCREWRESFIVFRGWALRHGYTDKLQIDRINNSRGYNPKNCRWATPTQNANNRRISLVFPNGDTCEERAKKLGITASGLRSRIKRWPILLAIETNYVPNGGLRRWFRQHNRWKEKE